MEMVIFTTFLGLNAMCSVACLVILLVMFGSKEIPTKIQHEDAHPIKVEADIEKRRRVAVQAREHQNFMDYDGTVQTPIDPNTILADGG